MDRALKPTNFLPQLVVTTSLAILLVLANTSSVAQSTDNSTDNKDQNKNFDVQSSVGNMHAGNDGTPREIGLPVYPGAHLRKPDKDTNSSSANLSLFTSAFGFKLVIANYDSDDAPAKVASYYREKLKKYGKVLECRTSKHGGDVSAHADNDDNDSQKSKDLKCDGDNTGNIIELKVGTENNQHVVSVEPAENGSGSTFAMVYVRARGKQGDI
jgi:hypothetical protein